MYESIAECLGPSARLSDMQVDEVREVIGDHAEDLVFLDVTKTALSMQKYAPDLRDTMLATATADEMRQFHYLQIVLEPAINDGDVEPPATIQTALSYCSFFDARTYVVFAMLPTSGPSEHYLTMFEGSTDCDEVYSRDVARMEAGTKIVVQGRDAMNDLRYRLTSEIRKCGS